MKNGFEGHIGYAIEMGQSEPTDLFPGIYYLCFENGNSVLRMKRPHDKAIKKVVFVADPRRLCKACHYSEVCPVFFCFFVFFVFFCFFVFLSK